MIHNPWDSAGIEGQAQLKSKEYEERWAWRDSHILESWAHHLKTLQPRSAASVITRAGWRLENGYMIDYIRTPPPECRERRI